jgi:hypothetical protein
MDPGAVTLSIKTLSITTLSIVGLIVTPSMNDTERNGLICDPQPNHRTFAMLGGFFFKCYAECHYAEILPFRRYVEYRYANCGYNELAFLLLC